MELFYFQKARDLNAFFSAKNYNQENLIRSEFLQSWQWGEILKREGKEILRIGIRQKRADDSWQVLVAATLIKEKLFGKYSYWYAPRGPIFANNLFKKKADSLAILSQEEVQKINNLTEFLFTEIRKIDSRIIFLRLEPQERALINYNNLSFRVRGKFKFEKTINIQPAQTLILDLNLGEEKLLAALHQKTRYNIRLAARKGVVIKEGGISDLPEFYRLLEITSQRDKFRLHSLKHYRNLVQGGGKNIRLFFAQYQGENISVALFSFYGNQVTYLHGASDNKFRNLMSTYLLQWTVIQKARQENYAYYDFFGIDEEKWPGVTRFKLGFGGQRIKYPGTYDLVFKTIIYNIYSLIRKTKRAFF